MEVLGEKHAAEKKNEKIQNLQKMNLSELNESERNLVSAFKHYEEEYTLDPEIVFNKAKEESSYM